MHTINFLVSLVAHHQALAYLVIYLGLVFEGEFFLISTGVLVHLGALNFWISLLCVLAGAFSKTFIGYAFGKFLYKKFNGHGLFRYLRRRVYSLLPQFKRRPFWSIFLSKFIFGANNIAIIFSGYERINYRKFLEAETLSILIWAPALLILGDIFSYAALQVSHEVWKFLMVVFIMFVIFILFDKLVSWLYELIEGFYEEE